MRTLSATIAMLLTAVCGTADECKFFNMAILSLPERYLAEVPFANRGNLLQQLSSAPA